MSKEVSRHYSAGAVFSTGWHDSTYGVLRAFRRGHPHGKMVLADSRWPPWIIGSMGFL